MASFPKLWAAPLFALLALTACGVSQQGDLDDDSQLALEIGVISTLASPNAMFPVALSDDLRQRHEGLEGIQLRNSAFGSNMPTDGGRIIQGALGGPVLETDITGPVTASIKVRGGEVGLVDGDIYIGEGTMLTNGEGEVFKFVSGQWQEAE